jgi:hypothetical protein
MRSKTILVWQRRKASNDLAAQPQSLSARMRCSKQQQPARTYSKNLVTPSSNTQIFFSMPRRLASAFSRSTGSSTGS